MHNACIAYNDLLLALDRNRHQAKTRNHWTQLIATAGDGLHRAQYRGEPDDNLHTKAQQVADLANSFMTWLAAQPHQ